MENVNASSTWITNDTETSPLYHAGYYALAYIVVGFISSFFILLVGVAGNVMVVIVVTRTRGMRTTTNCYLVSLAVADLMLLASAVLPSIVEYFLIVEQFIFGHVGCSLMVFLQYLGLNVSSLSITAFTIERYIAICHPLKAQTICTVHRAMRIITGLWLFGIAYCAPWLALASTRTRYLADATIEVCSFTLDREHYRAFYMADLVIFYALPLCLTLVLYGLITRKLFHTKLITTNRGGEDSKLTQAQCSISGNLSKKPKRSGSRAQVRYFVFRQEMHDSHTLPFVIHAP